MSALTVPTSIELASGTRIYRSLSIPRPLFLGTLTLIVILSPLRSKISSSTFGPILPVTSTSSRDQPSTATEPEMFEICTWPSGDASSVRFTSSAAAPAASAIPKRIAVSLFIVLLSVNVQPTSID